MKVPAIVQARMGSRRLPGKMLRMIRGVPVLQYVVERLQHSGSVAEIVVATSVDPSDDAIADFCRARGVSLVFGPVEDVAARFRLAVEQHGYERFFRVCGDRPLLDTSLLDRAAALDSNALDLVTNVHPKTFPSGQTVELVHSAPFMDAYGRMTDVADREHVTRYFYRHAPEYRIANFTADRSFDGVHLALDSEDDLRRFEAVVGRMTRPHWTYDLDEIIDLCVQ